MYPRIAAAWLLLLTFNGGLLGFRGLMAGELIGIFLLLNFLLATVPLVTAAALEFSTRRSRHPAHWLWFAPWLLFLPNAPYMVTDLIHLKERPPVPLWFDAALLFSLAGASLLIGYASVALVQRAIERRFGQRAAWTCVVTCLLLAAFGLYLGRILRWHSWHVLTRPLELASELWAALIGQDAGEPALLTLVYGVALVIGYLVLRSLTPVLASTPGSSTPSLTERRKDEACHSTMSSKATP